jgi:hypothetical protein
VSSTSFGSPPLVLLHVGCGIGGRICSVSERNCIIVEAGGGKGFWERNCLDPVQQLMGECVSC